MKKKIVKKVALYGICFLLISGILFGSLYAPKLQNTFKYTQADSAQSHISIPVGDCSVMPLAVSLSGTEEPGETKVGKLYDHNGREIKYIQETGQLINADGELLHTVSDNAKIYYDSLTQEILDSANRKMKIWYDSITLQHTLGSKSGEYLESIKPSDKVYEVSIVDRKDGLTKTIFVTKKRVKTGILDRLNPFSSQAAYKDYYYDLNGREIPDSWFVDHKFSPWWNALERVGVAAVGGIIGNVAGALILQYLFGVFVGYTPVSSIKIISETTLSELQALLEFATWHPWEKLDGVLTANNDGVYNSGVYINPVNGQLCDRLGSPLYHIETGYPFVLYEDTIITIPDKNVQTISDGILQNAATREYLFKLGFEPYTHYVDSYEFGTINILVLAIKDENGKLIKWVLPNGEDASSVVRNNVGIRTDGENLGDLLKGLSSGMKLLGWVLIIIVCVLVWKFVSWCLEPFKKKKQNGYKR